MKKFKSKATGLSLLQDIINKKGIEVANKELIEEILDKNSSRIVGYVRKFL